MTMKFARWLVLPVLAFSMLGAVSCAGEEAEIEEGVGEEEVEEEGMEEEVMEEEAVEEEAE